MFVLCEMQNEYARYPYNLPDKKTDLFGPEFRSGQRIKLHMSLKYLLGRDQIKEMVSPSTCYI